MDDLKLLVDMVGHLPQLALWVLLGYLVYKLAVVGSIYGVIRYVTKEVFSWLSVKKAEPPREVEYKEIRPMLDGMCIRASADSFLAQLHRLKGKGLGIESDYIHQQSVDWLREAIDAKIAQDNKRAAP